MPPPLVREYSDIKVGGLPCPHHLDLYAPPKKSSLKERGTLARDPRHHVRMRDALVVVDETLKLKIVFQKNTHITISGAVDGRRWHNQNEIQWNKGLRIQRPVSTPPPPRADAKTASSVSVPLHSSRKTLESPLG